MQSVTGGTVREDGNVYYVIGAADGKGEFLVRCKTIGQRNQLKGKGICFVEEAYKGDSTVTRGWAMYLTVGTSTTTTSPKWVKIAEEESVEGAWNLQQDLIRSLVKISTFTAHQQNNDAEFKRIWNKLAQIGSFDKHSHDNKKVLDSITESNGQLKYKGKPIDGSVYVYNKGPDASGTGLKWVSPVDETITSDGNTNNDIAELFSNTSAAYIGQTLRVVNLDNSVSTYLMLGDDSNLEPVFIGNTSLDVSSKPIKFVTSLPSPSGAYVNEIFCVLPPAYNGEIIGHLYQCLKYGETEYSWVDLTIDGKYVQETGAEITACYKTAWNSVKLLIRNPEDTQATVHSEVNDDDTDHLQGYDRFLRTTVVRKFGSSPVDKDDGEVIKISTSTEDIEFTDVIPLTKEDVYYGVFTETANGRMYKLSSKHTAKAEFLTWGAIADCIENGSLESILKVGDIISLPKHSEFGVIQCEVVDYEGDLALFAKNSIGEFVLDGIEYGKLPAVGVYEADKNYYRMEIIRGLAADRKGTLLVRYNKMTPGSGEYTIGDPIPENSGIFVGDDYSSTTSRMVVNGVDGRALHGNWDYESSNLKQWLNSNEASGWFVPRDEYDTLDPTYESKEGFLKGFTNNEFLRSIRIVSIMSDTYQSQNLTELTDSGRVPSLSYETSAPSGVYTSLRIGRLFPIFILKK